MQRLPEGASADLPVERSASESDFDRRRLANDEECRKLKQEMRESHAREQSMRNEHDEQTYQAAIKVKQVMEEQAAHGAEHARTEIDRQAALAQAEMLRAGQMVEIAE